MVAIPTDTVYGLAARLDRPEAIARHLRRQGPPPGVALPVLVGRTADRRGRWSARLAGLSRAVGRPLLARTPDSGGAGRPEVGRLLGGDGTTVGVRWPADPTVGALCHRAGPLVVTSANRHGRPPGTSAQSVLAEFADQADPAVIIDGGTRDGEPSTVVDCRGRPAGGAPARADLAPTRWRRPPAAS